MARRTFAQWLTRWRFAMFGTARGGDRRPRHSPPRRRIFLAVRALEEIASPTSLTGPTLAAYEPSLTTDWTIPEMTSPPAIVPIQPVGDMPIRVGTIRPHPASGSRAAGIRDDSSAPPAQDNALETNWIVLPPSNDMGPAGVFASAVLPNGATTRGGYSASASQPSGFALAAAAFGASPNGNLARFPTTQANGTPTNTPPIPALTSHTPVIAGSTSTHARSTSSPTVSVVSGASNSANIALQTSAAATAVTGTSMIQPNGPPPPIGGSTYAPNIVPLLYDSTSADPAHELVQTAAGSQGGNPMQYAFSPAGVRYADGTIQLTNPDLASAGFGNAWGQTRNWSNNPGYYGANLTGAGWNVSQMPFLQQQPGSVVALVGSGVNAYMFQLSNGVYLPENFQQNSLADNASTDTFTFTEDDGKVLAFCDFNSNVPAAEQGTLQSITDQFGDVTQLVSHTSGGQIQEIQASNTVGSTTITESYYYTYTTIGSSNVLSNVTLRRKINSGSWSSVRQVAYTYYGAGSSYGTQGDLELAQIEDGSGNVLQTWYYRYYINGTGNGFTNAVQYVFDPRSYARLAQAYSNPLTATNTQVAPYAVSLPEMSVTLAA